MALTVFELEAEGYTHASCKCGGRGHHVLYPFRILHHAAKLDLTKMSLNELRLKFICKRCPGKVQPIECDPWKQ